MWTGDEAERHLQIGEVAERTGLSLRTIRYYGEVGLVEPSARTEGGFRLYTARDVDRLQLVKQMKPLGFTLQEMRELVGALDELATLPADDAHRRARVVQVLRDYRAVAVERYESLQRQVHEARAFVGDLDSALTGTT